MATDTDTPIKYGVLDDEGYWMGNEEGPTLHTDLLLAKCLATVLFHQFKGKRAFTVAPFTSATKIHDTVEAPMTGLEALIIAEGRGPE